MLTNNFVEKWLEDLKTNWINKDINSILKMFSETKQYYETPFEDTTNQIEELWQEIKDQDIKRLDLKVLALDGNIVIVEWELTLKDNIIYNGIYEIEFNDNLMCVYFKQWYMQN